jgi:hypothetical protein
MTVRRKNIIKPTDSFALSLDVQITRRKFYHVILAPDADYVFKSKHVGDCLEWFNAEAIERFEVLSDNSRWLVTLERTGKRED